MDEHGSTRPVALVTGASSGIGAVYAERLASTGHDLILVARRRDRLEDLSRRLGEDRVANARVLLADPSEPDWVNAVEEAIAGELELALVVNNAGFSGYMPWQRGAREPSSTARTGRARRAWTPTTS